MIYPHSTLNASWNFDCRTNSGKTGFAVNKDSSSSFPFPGTTIASKGTFQGLVSREPALIFAACTMYIFEKSRCWRLLTAQQVHQEAFFSSKSVQCKERRHSCMGTMPPPSSQGTCYKEAPLVSRTRVRHQVLRDKEDWRMVVTRMSNPLPSHDPAQLDGPRLLLAGHLNYFKTGTDAAWKSRPAADNWIWAFTHFCLCPTQSFWISQKVNHYTICSCLLIIMLLPWDFPSRSILHSSQISPSPAHPNIHIHAHIHPTSQATHSSFESYCLQKKRQVAG